MRILLSNDDGIRAPGLAALYEAVADLGERQVVAPQLPQSAAGHAITLRQPLSVERIHLEGPPPFAGISVDGRPADCVRLALRRLLPEPVDLVLTGINAGSNVGINVFYSGTVAAAAEAAICGIPAVAFSTEIANGETPDFARVARLCRWVLDGLLRCGLAAGDLVNVNVPALGEALPIGLRVVRQSTAGIEDIYHPHNDANGGEAYRLGDQYDFLAQDEAETDVACLSEGYVTVTPLRLDMTHSARLEEVARFHWPAAPSDADRTGISSLPKGG